MSSCFSDIRPLIIVTAIITCTAAVAMCFAIVCDIIEFCHAGYRKGVIQTAHKHVHPFLTAYKHKQSNSTTYIVHVHTPKAFLMEVTTKKEEPLTHAHKKQSHRHSTTALYNNGTLPSYPEHMTSWRDVNAAPGTEQSHTRCCLLIEHV